MTRRRRFRLATAAAFAGLLGLVATTASVSVAGAATATTNPPQAVTWGTPGSATTLVLYDTTNTYGWLGELYAMGAGNLASHFGTVTAEPVVDYVQGQVNDYTATIYLGSTYNEPLPSSFLNDVLSTTHPVIWAGDNVWQLSGDAGSAGRHRLRGRLRLGPVHLVLRLRRHGGLGHLQRPAADPQHRQRARAGPAHHHPVPGDGPGPGQLHRLHWRRRWRATPSPRRAGPASPGRSSSGNLTYVGEIPLSYMTESDRYLAFSDLLFNALEPSRASGAPGAGPPGGRQPRHRHPPAAQGRRRLPLQPAHPLQRRSHTRVPRPQRDLQQRDSGQREHLADLQRHHQGLHRGLAVHAGAGAAPSSSTATPTSTPTWPTPTTGRPATTSSSTSRGVRQLRRARRTPPRPARTPTTSSRADRCPTTPRPGPKPGPRGASPSSPRPVCPRPPSGKRRTTAASAADYAGIDQVFSIRYERGTYLRRPAEPAGSIDYSHEFEPVLPLRGARPRRLHRHSRGPRQLRAHRWRTTTPRGRRQSSSPTPRPSWRSARAWPASSSIPTTT